MFDLDLSSVHWLSRKENYLEKKSRQSRDSNAGLLGGKQERFLCATQTHHIFSKLRYFITSCLELIRHLMFFVDEVRSGNFEFLRFETVAKFCSADQFPLNNSRNEGQRWINLWIRADGGSTVSVRNLVSGELEIVPDLAFSCWVSSWNFLVSAEVPGEIFSSWVSS